MGAIVKRFKLQKDEVEVRSFFDGEEGAPPDDGPGMEAWALEKSKSHDGIWRIQHIEVPMAERVSPGEYEDTDKMIQLGDPTFLVTWKPVELQWERPMDLWIFEQCDDEILIEEGYRIDVPSWWNKEWEDND